MEHMQGKICLVTGSTSGIGRVTALELAKMGATVVLACRDKSKGETTRDDIKAQNSNASVDMLLADLSSQQSVRQLARDFTDRYSRLDVLVNNAGGVFLRRSTTVDGLERTFAVNYLAPFLLTNLLLDTLKASAPARVVTVSSGVHQGAIINFNDLQGEKGYRGLRAYGQSKLATILFTHELAKRLQGTNVTANCLHPGMVASNFGQGNGPVLSLLIKLALRTGISPEKGAETSVYLASSPEVEGVTGKYFSNCKEVHSSKESYDDAAGQRLWEISAELTNL
jgi:NAD(P)-dependent dehydrogenase (short-subunit alcohol dehydrogenase family)